MLQGPRVSSEILAQGPDYTMASQTLGPLYGSIDQSMQGAQLYGLGPWSSPFNDPAPASLELGSNGLFNPTPGPTSGLGSLFNQNKPQQSQSSEQKPSFWFRIADAMTPGVQTPGGGAAQWWTGWIPKW